METALYNNKTVLLSRNITIMPRIAPFILFMCFIGIEELARILINRGLIGFSEEFFYYIYPVKTILVGFILYSYRSSYHEIELSNLFSLRNITVSVLCGFTVFVLWINMVYSINPVAVQKGFNPLVFQDQFLRNCMIVMRLTGAVLVVPVMEEIFWRSFFIRYLVNQNFINIPVGYFTWPSFLLSALFFGLEHDLIFAGIMAGIAYNLLLYYTRSIAHCILAHALTNCLLGIYVLNTHSWYFW